MEENKGFKSRIGFIFAAAGSAVGLGNLWAFPFKTGENGGAAFVLIYILMAAIIGFVGMVSEMYIGKRTGRNIVDSYKNANKKFTWVGVMGVLSTTIIASYYIVLGGWVLKYAYSYLIGANLALPGGDYQGYFNQFSQSGWEPILFMGIFFICAMLILVFGVQKGIERISKVLMPVLLVLMIGLMIRSLTLGEGVKKGIEFYLKPDFVHMKPQSVLVAMGQAFFSLSLGCGTMCVYGSYSKNHNGLAKSAVSVILLDTLVALIAGLIIFPAVFAFGKEPQGGPGLFFIVLPEIFDAMPAGRFFGFTFFFLVFIAAITSIISMVEVALQTTIEKTKIKRPVAVAIFTVVIFAIGSMVSLSQGAVKGLQVNGADLLTFFDTIISQYMMPFGTIIACGLVGWSISRKEINENFSDFKFRGVWLFFAKYITPILVGLILFFGIFSFEGGFHFANDWRMILTAVVMVVVFSSANAIYLFVQKKKNNSMPVVAVDGLIQTTDKVNNPVEMKTVNAVSESDNQDTKVDLMYERRANQLAKIERNRAKQRQRDIRNNRK